MAYLLLLAAWFTVVAPGDDRIPPEVPVVRVVDGDTVIIEEESGRRVSIRLVGVDTPETKDPRKPVQPYGPEASAFTKASLVGKKVRLVRDAEAGDYDRYGRRLAYVYVGSECFNETLVREGYGRVYLKYPSEHATRIRYLLLQEEARAARKGLWAIDD